MKPETKWTDRTHPLIVEVAEVLAIDTDLVMATMENESRVYVLYTPEREKALGDEILGMTMTRDQDGVLQQETAPERQSDLEGEMRRLRKEAQTD